MKNQIEEQVSGSRKITIDLHVDEYAEIERMAIIMGATVEQTAEAMLYGHAEDYLNRQSDDVWECLIDYISDVYGSTPRLRLCQRYMAAARANSYLPSGPERGRLYNSALSSVESYAAYLLEIGADEQDIDMVVTP